MNIVIKTLFISVLAISLSQTAQAGKIKDFFTNKHEAEKPVQAVKSKKKENWFKRTFKKDKADKLKPVANVKPIKKPQAVVVKQPAVKPVVITRPVAPVYQGYKRVPRTVVASTWLQDNRRNAHIESERELDSIVQLNDRKALQDKLQGKAAPAPKKQATNVKNTNVKKDKWYKKALKRKNKKEVRKSDKKGNWFSRNFKNEAAQKKK